MCGGPARVAPFRLPPGLLEVPSARGGLSPGQVREPAWPGLRFASRAQPVGLLVVLVVLSSEL